MLCRGNAPGIQLGTGLQRNPEINGLRWFDSVKPRCGHSNNRARNSLQVERLPDYRGVSREGFRPEAIAQDDYCVVIAFIVRGKANSAQDSNSQAREIISADFLASSLGWSIAIAYRHFAVAQRNVSDQIAKHARLLSQCLEHGKRKRCVAVSRAVCVRWLRASVHQHNGIDVLWVMYGKHFQQERIERAEYCCVRSDAQRKCQHRDSGKSRALAQLPQCVAKILQNSV